MKTLKYLVLLLMVPAVLLTSCKDDDTPGGEETKPAEEILVDYMLEMDMDLDHILKYGDFKFVTGAPATADDVATWAAGYHIMDIRSQEAFDAGHIDGAILTPFADLLTEAANAGSKKILVVCYSGQTACFGTALLRMAGFREAQALKWGMSGWNQAFSATSWDNATADLAKDHANWSYDAAPANNIFEMPEVSSTSVDGATILANQIAAVLAEGFGANVASAGDVLETPLNYFINNYFSEADYSAFGHIDGAYRINPLLISDNSMLNLDPDAKVVTYCYTGQTSAVITAYLNVLGYDAYSLTYGMNKLYNSNSAWSSNQWGGDSNAKDLPFVETK